MMADRHYDDEALISLLESNHADTDDHITACEFCSEKLQSVREITSAMRDPAVWDTRVISEEPVASTIANLRAFANRMADEDAAAEAYVADLLDGPRETWMAKLEAHPEYRTAGVVRRLIGGASQAVDTMPPDAVEMTALATEIAENLDPGAHTSDVVSRLRGQAWRERAYLLFYTGQFDGAFAAIDRAEAHLSHCIVDEYEKARLGMVRAMISRPFGQVETAIASTRTIGKTFAHFGDTERAARAVLMRGNLLVKAKDFRGALDAYLSIDTGTICDDTYGRLEAALAYCYREMGDLASAMPHYELAAAAHQLSGNLTEATRLRWSAAGLLITTGRLDEAWARLTALREELRKLGMAAAASEVGLELADILCARGNFVSMEELCRELMAEFNTEGLAQSTRALTALGFLEEAIRERRVSRDLVRHVRTYIGRLKNEPQLLFAPLPE